MSFSYSRGSVKTTNRWVRPTKKLVSEYFSYVKNNSNIFEKYDLYIVGGFLYNPTNTWDIDIRMIGKEFDPVELEEDQNYLLDTALNRFNLLVDAKWRSELFKSISYEDTINPNYEPQTLPSVEVMNIFRTIDGYTTKLEKPDFKIVKQFSEHLVLINHSYKIKSKFLEVSMKNPGKDLLQSMSVVSFLSATEEVKV
jgi:hypothetical protein